MDEKAYNYQRIEKKSYLYKYHWMIVISAYQKKYSTDSWHLGFFVLFLFFIDFWQPYYIKRMIINKH